MAKLYYQGHGSYRITAADGAVIYVDPFAGDGYDIPADLVLVTHEHSDHNVLSLITKKPGCTVLTEQEALAGNRYNQFEIHGIRVEAVPAENVNHNPKECVGYVLTLDGVTVYAAGDTSKTDWMEGTLAQRKLTYALLPIDGIYNMGPEEASECARLLGAKHSIPIHMAPGELFRREFAEKFQAPGRMIVEPGQELDLNGLEGDCN